MEWARKLSEHDVKVLSGKAPYSEKVPDVDEGFTPADLKDTSRFCERMQCVAGFCLGWPGLQRVQRVRA